ncbi:MAG: HYR domain-containing protein, partial [Candidatus Dadabacteria bacterium]
GNVTLAGPFTVHDNKIPGIAPVNGPLTPGGTLTVTASYTVAQTDLNTGSVTNAAYATTTSGTTTVTSNTDTETATATQSPALSINKQIVSGSPYSAVGGVITYTYSITNTGNVTLAGPFTVHDNKIPGIAPVNGPLTPGSTLTVTASYTVTQADLNTGSVTNAAYATTTSGTTTVTSNTDTETATATQSAALSINKQIVSGSPYSTAGGVITYTYTITNSGNVTLAGPFTVHDNKIPGIAPVNGPLTPGSTLTVTASYTVTQTDLNTGSVTNAAYATTTSGTTTVTSNTDTETATATQRPSWTLAKTASETTYSTSGEVIHYSLTLHNTGNVSITSINVTDAGANTVTYTSGDNGNNKLDVGETWVYIATHTITQSDVNAGLYTNTATVHGVPAGGTLTDTHDTETVYKISSCTLSVTAIVTNERCQGSGDGSIDITISGNNSTVTYMWNDGVTKGDRTGLSAGTYTLTVYDAVPSGCTATATFVVTTIPDNTPPTITCPANSILNLNTNCSATLPDYRSLATINDNCTSTSNLVIIQNPAPGTVLTGTGASTVTLTVTDLAGKTASCSFIVTRTDNIKPVINCSAPKYIACDLPLVFDTPSAADNCGTVSITVVSTTSTETSNAIVYTRTWLATDASGNTSSCTQTVTHYVCNGGIYHTPATCNDYKNGGNGYPVSQICYTPRKNKVFNAIPGQFFYYSAVTAPSPSFCINVVQTKSCENFTYFDIQQSNQIILWDPTCTKAATGTKAGDGTICITDAIPGVIYILSVKYDTKSLIGSTFTDAPPVCEYTFETRINEIPIPKSRTTINVGPYCTDTYVQPQDPVITQEILSINPKLSYSNTTIAAYPNPYGSTINFTIVPAESGKATLELFDLLGRKVAIVYNGTVTAHQKLKILYDIPPARRIPVIYRLWTRQGFITGKLLPGELLDY